MGSEYVGVERQGTVVVVNNVLRQTYMLLSLMVLFCAFGSLFAMKMNSGIINPMFQMFVIFGLFALINVFRNSALGLVFAVMLSTFLGYTLGPLLSMLLSNPATSNVVSASLFATSGIVGGVSLYAINSTTDFSYMRGLYVVGLCICILLSIANYFFFQMSGIALLFSCMIAVLSAGGILWRTSDIVHGGQHNYILAALGLFIDIYNLFISILHIMMALSSNRD